MALNDEYFNSIELEIAKKKYYNANKVEAVLRDIRDQALQMERENSLLRQQLAALTSQKSEIGDALLSARSISQRMIEEARAQADGIVAEAEEKSRSLLADARSRQERMVSSVQSGYDRIRAKQYEAIETLNREWQEFLCNLETYEEQDGSEQAKVPEDLSEKVNAIAKLLSLTEE